MKKKYFSLEKEGNQGVLYIYGDITSEGTKELVNGLNEMKDVEVLRVYINSFGGEVAGGLAIYNALMRHPAKVITYNDGLMASAATIPFCAGMVRVVGRASSGLIHQAWAWGEGNANDFIKQAEDLKVITQNSIEVYKSVTNLSDEEIVALMDEERWLSPDEMLELGFATKIKELRGKGVQQSVKLKVLDILMASRKEEGTNPEDDDINDDDIDDDDILDEEDGVTDEDDLDEPPSEDEEGELEDEEETPEDEGEEETPAQQAWLGFFNALVK